MFEEPVMRAKVDWWLNAREEIPSRKELAAQFPDVPVRIIRAALQSRKDRKDRETKT